MTAADVLKRARELGRRTFSTSYTRSGQRVVCRVCSRTWFLARDAIAEGAALELLEHAEAHELAAAGASRGGA